MKAHLIFFAVCIILKYFEPVNSNQTDLKIMIEPLICSIVADEISLKDTCTLTSNIFNELNCINVINSLRSAILQNYTGFKVVESLEGKLICVIFLDILKLKMVGYNKELKEKGHR